jgi:hypothetical protein
MAPKLDRATFQLNWPAEAGRQYQVEYSADLLRWLASPTGWITAGATTASWDDAGPPGTDAPPAIAPMRYYRVFRLGSP